MLNELINDSLNLKRILAINADKKQKQNNIYAALKDSITYIKVIFKMSDKLKKILFFIIQNFFLSLTLKFLKKLLRELYGLKVLFWFQT